FKKSIPVSNKDPNGAEEAWVEELFGDKDPGIKLARSGSPLRLGAGNWHQFIHASLIDYFMTKALWLQSKTENVSMIQMTAVIQPKKEDKKVIEAMATPAENVKLLKNSAENMLNSGILTRDQIF